MLLEREWVALGHKFSERYGNSRDVKAGVKVSTTFLLFFSGVTLQCLLKLEEEEQPLKPALRQPWV